MNPSKYLNKKESVSITTCIGRDLFEKLNKFCSMTGQSKTIAVERAIKAYCQDNSSMLDLDELDLDSGDKS